VLFRSWTGDQTIPGNYAHAEGYGTITVGEYSHAEGTITQAIGDESHAEGSETKAIGQYSHAEGSETKAIGDYSHAEGDNTQAVGNYSHAEGQEAISVGSYSHAEGYAAIASGSRSHAEGENTIAIGYASHAEGYETKTGIQNAYEASVVDGIVTLDVSYGDITGDFGNGGDRLYLYDAEFDDNYGRSIFIIDTVTFNDPNTVVTLVDTSVNTTTAYVGNLNIQLDTWNGGRTIPGDYSHTEGDNTQAIGKWSHAENSYTLAIGDYSHAEGESTQAIGYASHAEGGSTRAIGDYSHAEGENTETTGYASHAEGQEAISVGQYSHAEGYDTRATGNYSHAEGAGTKTGTQNAYYAESVVSGVVTLSGSYGDIANLFDTDDRLYLYDAPFDNAYPFGAAFLISQSYFNSTNTVVELYDTSVNTTTAYVGYFGLDVADILNWAGDQTIPGEYAHAEGAYTFAIGLRSHAEGSDTQVLGYTSHAEGIATIAVGLASHAEGSNTYAIGVGSHAEGQYTQAIGQSSHAEGDSTQAIGQGSHAEGLFTVASGSAQHVSGRYNQHNNPTSYFVVGIGLTEETRKDGFTVDVDANGSGSVMIPTNIDLPSNPKTGSMYFDTAINYLCIYNGTEWRYISTAAVPA
jgi:autotransporter adhesin